MNTSSTTTTPTASAESPILEYVTLGDAADWIDSKPWPIKKLAESGTVRSVRFGKLTLVCLDDVEARADYLRGEVPATAEALATLDMPLRIINESRGTGTSHTVESLALACGVVLEEATRADVSRMARHIGGVLMA